MSYGTISEADAYWFGNASWLAQDDATKQRNLDRSEAYLDSLNWQGELTDSVQDIAWPRTGVIDKEGRAVPSDSIPADIVAAFFECGELSRSNNLFTVEEAQLTAKTVTAGSVTVAKSYAGSSTTTPPHGVWVDNLISQYLKQVSSDYLLRA